jgi:NTP pyrophosphatase (non-canonical NTP hydrolase)
MMTQVALREKLDLLNGNSSLKEVQSYVNEMIDVRGFGDETLKDLMILLTEEMGELAKEVRKLVHMKTDVSKKSTVDIEGELADIFIYLLSICRNLNIDLFEAFKVKEEKNSSRIWKLGYTIFEKLPLKSPNRENSGILCLQIAKNYH